jgi:hypothetical protein
MHGVFGTGDVGGKKRLCGAGVNDSKGEVRGRFSEEKLRKRLLQPCTRDVYTSPGGQSKKSFAELFFRKATTFF